VFNNYIDRDIDRKMERTKNRVLVKGLISPAVSLVYATLLGIAGCHGDGTWWRSRSAVPVQKLPRLIATMCVLFMSDAA
jgi:heme O synthase-like polyprenyltransferase